MLEKLKPTKWKIIFVIIISLIWALLLYSIAEYNLLYYSFRKAIEENFILTLLKNLIWILPIYYLLHSFISKDLLKKSFGFTKVKVGLVILSPFWITYLGLMMDNFSDGNFLRMNIIDFYYKVLMRFQNMNMEFSEILMYSLLIMFVYYIIHSFCILFFNPLIVRLNSYLEKKGFQIYRLTSYKGFLIVGMYFIWYNIFLKISLKFGILKTSGGFCDQMEGGSCIYFYDGYSFAFFMSLLLTILTYILVIYLYSKYKKESK